MTPTPSGRVNAPLLVTAAGVALVALSATGIALLPLLAHVLTGSPLSATLNGYYASGQWVVGLILTAGGLAAWRFPGLILAIPRCFLTMPASRFKTVITVAGLAAALAVQFLLFDNIPHVTDSISHDFQARLVASGHTVAPRPPCHEAFFQHHFIMTEDGKWFSKYTPGHPVLLAIGYVLNACFLPVALCHGLTVLLMYLLAARFFDDRTGRWSALLYVTSPLGMLLGGSFMSHTSFLFMVLAGIYGLVRASDAAPRSRTAFSWSIFAGLFWGWALITRPQDAAIGVLMVAAALLLQASPRLWLRFIHTGLTAIIGLIPPLLVYLLWNKEQYGVFLTIGYGFNQSQVINRVYQATFGLSEHFTLSDAFKLMVNTAYRFDRAALGWITTLPLCLPAFVRHRFDRRDLTLGIAGLIHVAVYFFYDYYGLEFEARYYFNLLPMVVVLVVRSFAPNGEAAGTQPRSGAALTAVVAAMIAHNALVFWPRVILPHYGPDYEQASRALNRDAMAAGLSRAVVLVDSTGDEAFRYSSGMIYNDPFLQGDIIYARRLDRSTTDCLMNAFPDRRFFEAIRDKGERAFRFREIGPADIH